MTGTPSVTFFFGAMSPYSWFAAERIDRVLPGATWQPLFAGGLFKGAGRSSWGLDERRGPGIADCEFRAAAHGLGPIEWPRPWPTLDLLVARAMLVAEAQDVLRDFALTAMRFAFLEGADLGHAEAIATVATRVGLDPAVVAAEAGSPRTKAALRERTESALARGVVGVPSVIVGERVFWGDDRLEDAASATTS